VTGRPTFGDFIRAAHDYLEPPAGPPAPVAKRRLAAVRTTEVQDVTHSLHRVIGVMTRYLDDITGAFDQVPVEHQHLLTAWPRASIQARDALHNAAAFLQQGASGWDKQSGQPAADSLASRLDGVAASLATGRDLLHTHFAPRPGGSRQDRSEWAAVVVSTPVTRALLVELAGCARRIAPQGADLALSRAPAQRSSGQARRRLNAACQWLWVLSAAIQSADRQDPVSTDERRLLHSVPVNALAPRSIPDGSEQVTDLCEGAINSAERVRHHAWAQATRAPWSPGLTVTSLRQVAATSMVTSHHCEMLLRSLAVDLGAKSKFGGDLLESAAAAAHARGRWLGVAQLLDHMTTDTRGYLSRAAAESADLALWTGRLAYSDPEWTLDRGPSHPPRSPQSLAREAGDIPRVVAAVHQASQTMTRLAQAEHDQTRAAANAGRLLVSTRSLPESYDIPHPFAPAPPDRIGTLLSAYSDASRASAEATAGVARVAASVLAPSHVLTTAKAAVATGRPTQPRNLDSRDVEVDRHELARELPGPVERTLHDLGVTNSGLLLRGAAVDRAGERLIIDAAEELNPRHRQPVVRSMASTSGQTELINNILASGDSRAAALLRPPAPQQLEAELEP
jgi:hypothetical protein